MTNPSRRALLAAFLAAPAAVKLAPWVRPAPMAVDDIVAVLLAEHQEQLQNAVLAMFAAYRQAADENVRIWCEAMEAAHA